MRPTAREIIEGIIDSLERVVMPVTEDKWAASVLRSSVSLLTHLAVRADQERRILLEDTADVRAVLAQLADRLGSSPAAAGLRQSITALRDQAPVPEDDPAALDALNEKHQEIVEKILADRALAATRPAPQDPSLRDDLRRYLRRRLEREQSLYFPAFTKPPF
jgi:hypothetical protein